LGLRLLDGIRHKPSIGNLRGEVKSRLTLEKSCEKALYPVQFSEEVGKHDADRR
jgi:hypothetical protein